VRLAEVVRRNEQRGPASVVSQIPIQERLRFRKVRVGRKSNTVRRKKWRACSLSVFFRQRNRFSWVVDPVTFSQVTIKEGFNNGDS
jgi:hypothetical protein